MQKVKKPYDRYFIAVSAMIFGILAGYTIADEAFEGHTFIGATINGSIYVIIYAFIFILYEKINDLSSKYSDLKAVIKSDPVFHPKGEDFLNWGLSSSEIKVFRMLVDGMDVHEIAENRGSSEKTVRAQMSNIYKKSGLKNQTELIAKYQTEHLA